LITNEKIRAHKFLEGMYSDSYFPKFLVDECREILLELCERIETEKPADAAGLYVLSQAATEKINDLQDDFLDAGSELETAARDCIVSEFEVIFEAYGWDVDLEEAVPYDF
jgi:hypothetical protein